MASERITSADCLSCGACCADGKLVNITPRDKKRLGDVAIDVVGDKGPGLRQVRYAVNKYGDMETRLAMLLGCFHGKWLMPKAKNNRCVALRGRVGREVHCSVYDKRPDSCRRPKPGNPGCLEARAAFGVVKKSKKEKP